MIKNSRQSKAQARRPAYQQRSYGRSAVQIARTRLTLDCAWGPESDERWILLASFLRNPGTARCGSRVRFLPKACPRHVPYVCLLQVGWALQNFVLIARFLYALYLECALTLDPALSGTCLMKGICEIVSHRSPLAMPTPKFSIPSTRIVFPQSMEMSVIPMLPMRTPN